MKVAPYENSINGIVDDMLCHQWTGPFHLAVVQASGFFGGHEVVRLLGSALSMAMKTAGRTEFGRKRLSLVSGRAWRTEFTDGSTVKLFMVPTPGQTMRGLTFHGVAMMPETVIPPHVQEELDVAMVGAKLTTPGWEPIVWRISR